MTVSMVRRVAALVVLGTLFASGCTDGAEPGEPRTLEVWFHAGEGPERSLLEEQVRRFNEAQPDITVLLRVLPEGPYDGQVAEAAADGSLPDVLDVNRLTLAGGDVGRLLPIDSFLPRSVLDSLVSEVAVTGRVGDRLMGAPSTTHTVLVAADPAVLRRIDAWVPSGLDDAWTLAEFEQLLGRVSREATGPALELPHDPVERGAALAALVGSAGGQLVAPGSEPGAGQQLTRPAQLATATIVARWLREGLAEPAAAEAAQDESERPPLAFVTSGSVPPEHLVAAPPDLGGGTASLAVGHVWVIPESSRHPAEAAELIQFLLSPEEVEATAEVSGGVPSVRPVLDARPTGPRGQARASRLAAQLLLAHAAPPVPVAGRPTEVLAAYAEAVAAAGEGEEVWSALVAAGQRLTA